MKCKAASQEVPPEGKSEIV